MKPTARIDFWTKWGNQLVGEITLHDRQDEFHSSTQITSELVKFEPENNHAETLNTIYVLGPPAPATVNG